MKTFNKNSLIFKRRAWIIMFSGILQVLHYIAILFLTKDSQLIRECWFWIIFVIAFTFWEIKDDFSIGRLDGVVVQIIDFVISVLYLLAIFSANKVFIIAIVESVIILLGVIVIYKGNYKTIFFTKVRKNNPKKK